MTIDHIALVVKSIEAGVKLWEEAFQYKPKTSPVVNTRQKVKVVFLTKEDSVTIKLVEPLDRHSPVFALAARGGGLHHICFKCADVSSELARLETLGGRTLSVPQPGEAFEDELIAFLFAGQGLNIELIDTDKKACLLK
jgi:methylmalonyl-CoA/ethylmalonyl-CoA epimerase